MTLLNVRSILKFDHLMLLPVLGLAFYIAFIPHEGYPYAIHVDEWVHLTRANLLMSAESVTFPGVFSLEVGFHLLWGVFQTISGISWMDIFRYFPGIIFIITVLSVYILAQREGFGWEAAFFTCLIPSTMGIMGPAFLVPVSMGLLFTPLYLFVAFNFRTVWSYLLIFVFTAFLLSIHAPSAISPIIVLIPYILLNLKVNFKHSLGIGSALMLPFLAAIVIFPWIYNLLLPTGKSLFIQQSATDFVQLPRVIQTYGYLPILFCLLGTFMLAIRGGKKNYSLILGLLALLLMLVTFFTLHYGVSIMYERGLMYMMLMVSIVAGAGLAEIKNLKLPARLGDWLQVPPLITQNTGKFLSLALVGIILAISIPVRLDTPYYRMIDRQDYESFVWIRDNVNEDYGKAMLDPWKATAFTAITHKNIHTRIHMAPTPKDKEVYAFIKSGSRNTTFLRENGISILYTRISEGGPNTEYSSDNPDLVEVAKNIYLLRKTETGE